MPPPPRFARLAACLLALTALVAAGVPARASSPDASAAAGSRFTKPVLAFYYTWYHPTTWCRCTMSDLPPTHYESSDPATIDRQIAEAAAAGVTGFIASWPGRGSTQDANLALLLAREVAFQKRTGIKFVTSIYLESDIDPAHKDLSGSLAYVLNKYSTDPHFFRWHGKPVIFIWDPLGGGRTLATWTGIRNRVDPGHRSIWSAEGTDTSLLSVFDGLHLFSAADWGLLDGTVGAVDRSFRTKVDAASHQFRKKKIWAAGVAPGYNDARVPGRSHPHIVPRNGGETYRSSWLAAISSRPDWITISTWNEWFEGAMIEPSVTYRRLYLRLTGQYARQWRASR